MFEIALAATTLPDVDEIRPDRFLPSSRSIAFRRRHCSTSVSSTRSGSITARIWSSIRSSSGQGPASSSSQARSWNFAPRPSAWSALGSVFSLCAGRRQSGSLPARHASRYARISWFCRGPSTHEISSLDCTRNWRGSGIWQGRSAVWQAHDSRRRSRCHQGSMLIPGLRVVGDLAKMAGYPAGLWWRLQSYGFRAAGHDAGRPNQSRSTI